ncbi:MAG TPA: glycosyltransferase family 2 protein [Gemmatimonadales bacterium]|nr:glycosyltransferase family 2 protein [Gemmatimonadales bacterium]
MTAELQAIRGPSRRMVSIVIPAFNEGRTIGRIVCAAREQCPAAEIVVVDDASTDDTAEQAAAAGANVIRRPYNVGNGAGVKTGVRASTGDVVVVLDGDGQHDPADIPRLVAHIGPYDMVIGERARTGQQNATRWLGNAVLNRLGTYLVGVEMRDLTSGFRAMRRDVLVELLHLLPNRFSWPTTSALAFAKGGYHVRFVPITVNKRTTGRSSQQLLPNGVKFFLIILRIATLFSPLRIFFPISLLLELLAAVAYGWSVARGAPWLHLPPSTVMFFLGGIVLFLFGLISEQIASLRFRGPEHF